MPEICFDGIVCQPSLDIAARHEDEFKGAGGNALTAIAGIAVSIAVPFLAPTVAGAIFGASAMAGLSGAILAGGVGAALGAAGAYLTGNDPLLGALTGGLGAGAVQGFGAFGSVAGTGSTSFLAPGGVGTGLVNFGQAVPGAVAPGAMLTTPTGAAISATQQAAISGLGAPAAGVIAPAAGGFMGLGATEATALGNAAIMAAPQAIGMLGSEFLPPSDQALATEAALKQQFGQQQDLYTQAMNTAQNISPELMAQNLAGQAQLQSAQVLAEGDSAGVQGGYDPAREEARQRKQAVAGSTMRGTGYMQGMLAGTEAQTDATVRAAGLRPGYADYLTALSNFGTDAERKRRAAELSGFAEPFAGAFVKAKPTDQVQNT